MKNCRNFVFESIHLLRTERRRFCTSASLNNFCTSLFLRYQQWHLLSVTFRSVQVFSQLVISSHGLLGNLSWWIFAYEVKSRPLRCHVLSLLMFAGLPSILLDFPMQPRRSCKPTIWCCYHWTLKGRTSMLEVFVSKASCHSCRKDWLFREGALGVSCLTGDCVSIRHTFFSHTKLREAVQLQSISISLHMATISRQQWIWYQRPPAPLHASDFYIELGVRLHGLMNVWTTNHKQMEQQQEYSLQWRLSVILLTSIPANKKHWGRWGHPEISHWQAVWSKHLE